MVTTSIEVTRYFFIRYKQHLPFCGRSRQVKYGIKGVVTLPAMISVQYRAVTPQMIPQYEKSGTGMYLA
jgi:hypothetical protein